MENGISVPSEALTKLICKEIDINTEWLKFGRGPVFESDINIDLINYYDQIIVG